MKSAPKLRTPLCDLLGCEYPIIQTAMGWVAGADLVAGTTNEQRADLYQQAEVQADKDTPVIPIYHYVSPRLIKPYVEGFSKDPLDKFYFKDISFKK